MQCNLLLRPVTSIATCQSLKGHCVHFYLMRSTWNKAFKKSLSMGEENYIYSK